MRSKKAETTSKNVRKAVWSPDVKGIIDKGINHVRDRLREQSGVGLTSSVVTQADVAEACGVSTGVFSEIRNGHMEPNEHFAQRFVEFVYDASEANKRGNLRLQLLAAAKHKLPWHDSLFDRLVAGQTLTFTSLDYKPFAGSSECFFERVFSRFFDLAGIPYEFSGNRSGFQPEAYRNNDVTLALFDSTDRILSFGLKFWRVPIRMGLGAVCLERHHSEAHHIAGVLANIRSNTNRRIRPIVVKGEVGSIHCRKRLRLDRDLIEIPTLDVGALKRALLTEGGNTLPVVCTDEYTALRVLSTLGKQGYSVFPMNSRRVTRDEKELARRELPQYYCSIAIHRGDPHFQDFMQDALEQFLSTELETTSQTWFCPSKTSR